ncbi:MBL fold metallo-hydrolase [Desulfallas sp. Bu1-1]|uniref:MBL fold metallo-hydrolase n=1 Tax=Desulfallas sp. Bu1-1 TaxID=2787620 RepID=UPI0018A08C39|nr:MBL fold metallo-hydrolase [Desulfallas sp. Bu1-1]MBF7082932.1 MBL fold metallo-hydrolase [Desulfallas sp. Bu1-1]
MIEIHKYQEVTQIKMSRDIGGKPLYWVAAYFIDGMLVDTGCDYTSKELCDLLQKYDVEFVVNTHYHEDHVGANYLIGNTFNINIFAHPKTVCLMKQKPELYPYQEMVWGYPKNYENGIPVGDKINTLNFSFDVIETPGHCDGHIVLLETNKGWCFTGDLFVSENPKVIRPEEDITQIVNSMERILNTTKSDLVLFTSIGRIVENGRSALAECINYLKNLSREVKELYQKGYPISTIRDMLFGGEGPIYQRTNNQFSSENLIKSALAANI